MIIVYGCKVIARKSHYPKENLPKGWIITDLDSLCTTINGLWKGVKGPLETIGVIRNANFTKEFTLDYSKIEYIDVESRSFEKRYLDDGDIIVEKSGGSDNYPVGRSILYNGESRKYSFSNFTMSLRLIDKRSVLPKYLYYVLQQKYRRGDMKQMQTQTTGLHNLLTDVFLSMPIPIPPKEEQKRIIERVDALFTVVSGIDALQGDLAHSVDAAKSSILELAIHGKLVPQNPSDEPAIELLKRINPAFQPSHNLHYLDCPSGWAVTQMKSIIELFSGRDLDNSRCNFEGYGVPYLVGASCIDKGCINIYRWTETPEVISKEGDVLLSCKGTVGEVVLNTMGNLHIARQFMAIRSKAPQYILPDYLGIIIKASIETLKKAARGIIPGISREDILGLTVMIPPSEEQQRILSRLAELNQSVSLIVANTCN